MAHAIQMEICVVVGCFDVGTVGLKDDFVDCPTCGIPVFDDMPGFVSIILNGGREGSKKNAVVADDAEGALIKQDFMRGGSNVYISSSIQIQF